MREVVMPKSSMTMTEGELTKWLVADGDEVKEGDPVAIILTDKVEMEVETPEDGRIAIMTEEGTTVPVGHAIAVILRAGESKPQTAPDRAAAADGAVTGIEEGAAGTERVAGATSERPGASVRQIRASPAARAMARRLGVDLAAVEGSGPCGRIRPGDVAAHAAAPRPVPSPRLSPDGAAAAPAQLREARRYRPSGARGVMARRMQEAAAVPQFTLFADVPLVAAERARVMARQEGLEDITVTDVLLKAVALTLPGHAILNSHYVDGEVVSYTSVHLGVAVDTDVGLIVPVVADADTLDLAELSRRRRDLAAAARVGRLRPDEVSGATFTVTNLGMLGVTAFQPVVDPPCVAILAAGRMRNDAGRTATLALGADHRVVDGAQGARFLDAMRQLLEYPPTVFEARRP